MKNQHMNPRGKSLKQNNRMQSLHLGSRALIQWLLLPAMLVVLFFGWKFPLLGFLVPLVMMVSIIGAFLNGRYVCGQLCPRGAFYDRLLAMISRGKDVPSFFKNMRLRLVLLCVFMALFIFQISQNPWSAQHWGHVFWMMCLVTTFVGILLGIIFHQRAWCTLCPIGTLDNCIGGHKNPLQINPERCISCKKCERVCPIHLPIVSHKDKTFLDERDCLRCSECVNNCPKAALAWKPFNTPVGISAKKIKHSGTVSAPTAGGL